MSFQTKSGVYIVIQPTTMPKYTGLPLIPYPVITIKYIWYIEPSETNDFEELHAEYYSVQSVMEEVFFETEQRIILTHLTDVVPGYTRKWVIRNARETILLYFRTQRISGA